MSVVQALAILEGPHSLDLAAWAANRATAVPTQCSTAHCPPRFILAGHTEDQPAPGKGSAPAQDIQTDAEQAASSAHPSPANYQGHLEAHDCGSQSEAHAQGVLQLCSRLVKEESPGSGFPLMLTALAPRTAVMHFADDPISSRSRSRSQENDTGSRHRQTERYVAGPSMFGARLEKKRLSTKCIADTDSGWTAWQSTRRNVSASSPPTTRSANGQGSASS